LTKEEWQTILVKFFKAVYFERVQVNPSDRRVLLLENPYWPFVFKTALAGALFSLNVPGVAFVPITPLPIYITGKESGLIVDMGYYEIRVLAIVEGFPVMSAMKTCPVGMADVHARVQEDCKEEAGMLTHAQLEDITLQSCYVRAMDDSAAAEATTVKLVGKTVAVSGETRLRACDTLFGDNENEYSLTKAIVECLAKCSIDARPHVISNVVLCGGTSMLPGLAHRFTQEVNASFGSEVNLKGLEGKMSLFAPKFNGNVHAFVGASLVGSIDAAEADFMTKADYEGGATIPDWTTSHLVLGEADADQAAPAGEVNDWN